MYSLSSGLLAALSIYAYIYIQFVAIWSHNWLSTTSCFSIMTAITEALYVSSQNLHFMLVRFILAKTIHILPFSYSCVCNIQCTVHIAMSIMMPRWNVWLLRILLNVLLIEFFLLLYHVTYMHSSYQGRRKVFQSGAAKIEIKVVFAKGKCSHLHDSTI